MIACCTRTPSETKITERLAQLSANLDVYDTILSKTPYLAGDRLTLADLWHLPTGFMLEQAGYGVMANEKRPNVAR